jgi:hypothetical protein
MYMPVHFLRSIFSIFNHASKAAKTNSPKKINHCFPKGAVIEMKNFANPDEKPVVQNTQTILKNKNEREKRGFSLGLK